MAAGSTTDLSGVTTTYEHDVMGNLTDVYLPAVADALAGGAMASPHWQYGYDRYGEQTSQTDPRGRTTSFGYDDWGRRESRTLPAVGGSSVTETTHHDKFGRPDAAIQLLGRAR